MKKLIVSIFLFVLAVILTMIMVAITLPMNVVYYLIRFRSEKAFHRLARFFYQAALSIDQFDNVILQNGLNLTMTKRNGAVSFGDEDDTMSFVIAMNQKHGRLTRFGRFWAKFLNVVDPTDGGHMNKSIDNKRCRDLQAWQRIEGNYYKSIPNYSK